MKTVINIVLLLILMAMVFNVEISFSPFKITFDWFRGIAVILIAIGFSMLFHNIQINAYKDGSDRAIQIMKDNVDKKLAEIEAKKNQQNEN